MSGWGDLGELGIEGVGKVVDKYHDTVYDRLPDAKQTYRRLSRHNNDSKYSKSKDHRDHRSDDDEDDGPTLPPPRMRDSSPPRNGYSDDYRRERSRDRGYGSRYDDRDRDVGGSGNRSGSAPGDYSPRGYNSGRYVPGSYNPAVAGAAAGAAAGSYPAYPPPPPFGQQALPYAPAYSPQNPPRFPPPPQQNGYQQHDYGADSDDGYNSDDRRNPRKSRSDSRLGGRNRYDGSDYDSDSDRRSRRHSHHRHGHGESSEGGSERTDEKDGKKKKNRNHEIAITLAGALAGGLLAHEVSSKKGKPETFHALTGAVVGGLLAHEGNKFYEGHKEEVQEKLHKEKEKVKGDAHSAKRRIKSEFDDGYERGRDH